MGVECEIEREDDGGRVREEVEETFAAATGVVMMDYVEFECRVGLMQDCWNWADAREREWDLKDVS